MPDITTVLEEKGFKLQEEQPHLGGERYLMQAVTTTSGRKLILLGEEVKTKKKVVIKATTDSAGKKEIEHERKCRELLHKVNFAYDAFHSPREILHFESSNILVNVQEYVHQESAFIDRPIEEQFAYALKAFKAQESVRATTYSHFQVIKKVFEHRNASDYLHAFNDFVEGVRNTYGEVSVSDTMHKAQEVLTDNKVRIEQYGDFLTHTDFVPHNFRINEGNIYLLDYSSLRFGNKHEGWARFLNFMTLYNPRLEQALVKYVADNRAPEENESLWLMRLYRLGEIIFYYSGTLSNCDDKLCELNKARIHFWHQVLVHTLEKKTLPEELRQDYIAKRDSLRSEEEKTRQINLH